MPLDVEEVVDIPGLSGEEIMLISVNSLPRGYAVTAIYGQRTRM